MAEDQGFTREASRRREPVPAQIWQFLLSNKKWWLLPILLVFLLFGILMALGGSAAAPFIYTLF